MVNRGRKKKAYIPKSKNFPEMLETHWTEKNTRKRKYFNTSTPPAHT
jgi:hypothetical protein